MGKTIVITLAFSGLVAAGVGGIFAGKEASKASVTRAATKPTTDKTAEAPKLMPVREALQPGFNPCDPAQTSFVDIQLPGQIHYVWLDGVGNEVPSHTPGAVRHRHWGWAGNGTFPNVYQWFANRGLQPRLMPIDINVVRYPCP